MREHTEKKKRKSFMNGIIWSTKNIAINIPNVLCVSYISFYATNVLGMKATIVASVLLATKLLDGVTDLVSGFIIDNTKTRFGKARPYDFCILLIGILTVLLFSAPKTGIVIQSIYIAVMYILIQILGFTFLNTADSVYLLRAFPEEKERNGVFGASLIFGQIIGITAGVILPVLIAGAGTSHSAWTKVVCVTGRPFAILGMLRFFLIKERVVDNSIDDNQNKETKKKTKVGLKDGVRAIVDNRYVLILSLGIFIIVVSSGLLNTSMPYYFQYIVGDMKKMAIVQIGSYASLLMLIVFVPLVNKFGKGTILKAGLIISFVGCLVRWIGGVNVEIQLAGMAMLMFGIMPISLYFPLYIFDIMDYGEWKTGKRVEGLYAAFPTFANKVASGLSVSLGVYILGLAGFNGTAKVQSASALQAINVTYNVVPTFLIAVMILLLIFFYDIDKKMPQVKADLETRRNQDKIND